MGYYRIGCRLWSGLPGCERSRGKMHQTEVTSGKRPQLYFLCITAKGRLSLRQSDDYGKAREAARCTEILSDR
ncbi:MAG: hypothetical protein ACLSFV_11665 [Bacteroides xylanisolvens]